MIEINNSAEMAKFLESDASEVVKLPANANILLNDGNLDQATVEQLAGLGQMAGRSVHLPGPRRAS